MLSYKSKWNYMILAYMCLFIIFTVTVITSNGLVRLLAFAGALLIFVGVTKKKIKNAIFLIVAILPNTELLSGSFAGVSMLRIIFIVCLITILVRYMKGQEKDKLCVPIYFFAAWIAYITINLFINKVFSFQSFLSILGMMLIGISLQLISCSNRASSEKFILMTFVGFSFIVIVAYIELLLGKTFFYSLWTGAERYRYGILRVGSTVADPNNICFYLLPFLFWLNVGTVKNTIPNGYRKTIQVLTLVIILLTSSRAGLVALLLGICFCFFAKRKARLLILLPIIGLTSNYLLTIFEKLMSSAAESTNFRLLIIDQCLQLWSKNKVFGVGINNIMSSLGYESSVLNTMNTFVFMLTGLGVIGIAFYVLYWLFMIKNNIFAWVRKRKVENDQIYILACVSTTLVMAFTLDTFYMMLMWIMPAMIMATQQQWETGKQ